MRRGSRPARRSRGATLRTLIVGGAAVLVLSSVLMIAGLLVLATRMREALDREARALFAEQQTAAAIGREVERQLLDAAAYLNDPGPEALQRFRSRGQRVYDLERRYLFRQLSLRERLQVERVKELHQTLEVLAQAAFDARDQRDGPATAARAEALFAASEPVQRALDDFLTMREQGYRTALDRQAAVLQRFYVAAVVAIGLLLAAIVLAVRFVQRRILEPVDALAHAAERVGAGDLGVRVEEGAGDELSRLSTSFNAMTDGLARLQFALRDSEERYRRLVELTPDAIIVHDAGRVVLGNAEAVRLFGASSLAELAGTRLTDLLHPDASPALAEQLRAALAGGERTQPVELPFRRLDGGTVHGELVAAPFSYDGRAATLVAVRDASARREAEAALRETEERLRQAQKMEAVGRLAGGIAHDFNNLLTIILSHSELLLEETPDAPSYRSDVGEIRAAGMRAAALTRQLLSFSRKQVLQPEHVDLNEVVQHMTAWLHRLIASDIQLHVELAPDLDAVEADRGQLEQVILNLALNARDAMPDGGHLTIRTARVVLAPEHRDEGGLRPADSYVSLSVTDTGTGMDDATRARIFEPFFTTKDVGRGTGLGLATVYGIVQQSGGRIHVESAPGRGSRFEVLLPPHGAPAREPAAVDTTPVAPHGTETVLLAEDDAGVRALAQRALSAQGYRVLEARDGAEAEHIAATFDGWIDLLVTDVVMPGIGGRELARRLVEARPGLKVLFTSGYTEDEILRRGVVAHTHELLEKPYSPRTLAARVRTTLDGTS